MGSVLPSYNDDIFVYRAKKNENKNVIAQVKAEEVDGYCGEKSINDLLEVGSKKNKSFVVARC